VPRKKLTFALIAAMAIASAAQAGEKTSNGNRYGHDKKVSEPAADVAADGQSVALFRQAKEAYEEAWGNTDPSRTELISTLKSYHQASLKASDHVEKVDLSAEHKRINEYFKAAEKRDKIVHGFLEDVAKIKHDDPEKLEKSLEKLAKEYLDALTELRKLDKLVEISNATWKVISAYNSVPKVADAPATWTKSEKGVKKVKGAGSAEIDTHSVCKIVTNADGRQIFVSARTKEEWISDDRSFLKNLPEGVTAKNCPPPPKKDDDDDRNVYDQYGRRVADKDDRAYQNRAKDADRDGDGKVDRNDDGSYSDR
jgi:hypothetical protein